MKKDRLEPRPLKVVRRPPGPRPVFTRHDTALIASAAFVLGMMAFAIGLVILVGVTP